ncbi:hypothetical protein ScPMuIL_015123 [Solemya velum]
MPVFHTKTIESILEPVAQQVSKLVILHEEAEDGNAMPDLARPVQGVKLAVDNLVRVGYETINSSEDQILKQDMPPALSRVEEASHLLLQASELLRVDPFSAPARKKLIEGSRGILQGTSALLLAFDESEVRKIIRVCKNVLEYLAITEVVERMEDLVTYVKNLSPVLTKMTKEVDVREKELTHHVHRDMLIRSLDQVKTLTPVLISGIKVYITAKQSGAGIRESQTNRDYVVHKMSDEIYEIIRVLQLTTYDEEEWDADDLAVMKKAQSTIQQKMKGGQDWLADPSALVGSAGDKALHQILEEARKVADRCTNPHDRDLIQKCSGDIESMVDVLSELRQQGQGNSPQAISLGREIQQKMRDLENMVHNAIMNTERSGIRRPAPTVEGKVEQAQRWLQNPGYDDKGLGEQATRMVIAEGRHVAQSCTGPQRSELLRNCDEAEIFCNQLTDLVRRGQGDGPQAKAVAHHLSDKLRGLKTKIQDALLNQVAEDFIDISTPLKQLTEASITPLGTPHREENFDDKSRNFQAHSARLADTANMVATAGGCRNKRTVEDIFKASRQVGDLAPQVSTAARILFANPSNQAAAEHFELLKKQWTDQMEHLRGLVDEAVDTAALIKAEEEGILRDTERVEEGIRASDSPKIVQNASNVARRANRVLQVAQQEAENSEDPVFVDSVSSAAENLKRSMYSSRNLPGNDNLITLISRINNPSFFTSLVQQKLTVTTPIVVVIIGWTVSILFSSCITAPLRQERQPFQQSAPFPPHVHVHVPPPRPVSPPQEFGYYSDKAETPPRPPLPQDTTPPRPPPPETDDEDDAAFPIPQANQPIMMAAHALHMEAKQWSSKDNEIIAAAKRMALLMAKLSQLVRGEGGTKKDLIATAKGIAEASEEVTRLAKKLAAECTDKKMRTNLLQVCERIPTIGTQLKILSTVKATMLGAQGSEEDQEATEMLVGNAQNLMQAVKETVRAAEAASIKIRVDSGYTIRWLRKNPWYT